MASSEHVILEALEEASVLRIFAMFCEKQSNTGSLQRIRKIYSLTDNPLKTTEVIAARDFGAELSPRGFARLHELITAFIHKSAFRRPIPESEKRKLLIVQNDKCAFCGCAIDLHAHADHIVPFKYVGDELADNMQMLCSSCNTKKSADLFYQIKHLLGLV